MIQRQFNPNVSMSVFITRSLLLKAVKRNYFWLSCNKLLDVGSATKPYRELLNVHEYIGLDYKSEGHNHANSEVDYWYDGVLFPFDNETFDACFSSETWEHIFNPDEILDEIYRVLKPNSIFMCTTCFVIAEHESPIHFANYTSFGLKHQFEKHGFKVIHYEKLGTSIQAQMQMFMSYLDSYVIGKFKRIKMYWIVAPVVFTVLNLWCMMLNFVLPKRYDAFLGHVLVVQKIK